MFSSFATKMALKKAGLPSNSLDFAKPGKTNTGLSFGGGKDGGEDQGGDGWPAWMSIKGLPLTVHPWLTPPPAPVAVAKTVPQVGSPAPRDRDRKLQLGNGRRVLVVFLRCVGCAFAQKTFLHLRTIANRYPDRIQCVAVSHASDEATKKWIDMMGGAWNVRVVVDEDRSVYAAWGLGLGNVWYLFNPTTQMQGWKETGWLGEKVAGAMQKKKGGAPAPASPRRGNDDDDNDDAVATTMGNKWQESGAFAVDGKGTVIWGAKAARADELMNLDEGATLLTL